MTLRNRPILTWCEGCFRWVPEICTRSGVKGRPGFFCSMCRAGR